MAIRLEAMDPKFEAKFQRLLEVRQVSGEDVASVVSNILSEVQIRGDEAVFEYTSKFDAFDLNSLNMTFRHEEISSAREQCSPEVIAALELAATRITDYHQHQLPKDLDYIDNTGMQLGYRWTPIQNIGIYVPGGTAVYPSSVLMNALPAKIAGVDRIAMVVPTPSGIVNPLVLAAASIAGVDFVFTIVV